MRNIPQHHANASKLRIALETRTEWLIRAQGIPQTLLWMADAFEKKRHRNASHNQINTYLCKSMESENIKTGRGGYREGAGAKQLYGEPTVNITFRVPESHKSTIRRMVYDYMDGLKTNPKNEPKHNIPEYGC